MGCVWWRRRIRDTEERLGGACSPSPVKLQVLKGKAGAESDRFPEAELPSSPHPPTHPPATPLYSEPSKAHNICHEKRNRGLEEDRGAKKSSGVATDENRKGRKGS